MAAEEKKGKPAKQVTEKQRFNYIGFDVFPGKPKDLFKTEAEKTKFVDRILSKRDKGEITRDDCTLLEERVSFFDRLILTIASVVILGTLFIPWYSAYNKVVVESVVEKPVAAVEAVVDSTALLADSTALLAATEALAGDGSTAEGLVEDAAGNETAVEGATEAVEGVASEELLADATAEVVEDAVGTGSAVGTAEETREGVQSSVGEGGEQVLHSYVARKKYNKEYSRLTGIGSLVSMGSVGSKMFSSGLILILTAVFFLVYTLLCIVLPAYTLYGLYGQKGNADQVALKLKKMLKFNWIPVVLFFGGLVISFLGGTYGFDVEALGLSSISDSYGPGVFLGTLSHGVMISLSSFILVAVKGVEI